MTTSSTYATLQARIADEVLGAVTSAHIVNAIADAIAKYERFRFYFNGIRDVSGATQAEAQAGLPPTDGIPAADATSFTTVAGQEFYSQADSALIGSMAAIDNLVLTYGGNQRFVLHRRTASWMDDNSFSTSWHGMPTDWAWIAGSIRLYPIPDNAYPIAVSGTQRLPALVNPTDSNAWTQDAEELIRTCAEGILYRRIVRDAAQAQMCAADEAQALASLQRETAQRAIGTGRIRPHGAL